MKQQTAVEWLITELNQELNYIPITQWDRIRDLVQRAKQMEKEQQQIITDKITRFEVIDHTSEMLGRMLVKYGVNVEISIQDDGRTMKVFLTDKIKHSNDNTINNI